MRWEDALSSGAASSMAGAGGAELTAPSVHSRVLFGPNPPGSSHSSPDMCCGLCSRVCTWGAVGQARWAQGGLHPGLLLRLP